MAAGPHGSLLLDGVQEGLMYLVDRAERSQSWRLVVASSVRVDEAGELAALFHLFIPEVGSRSTIGNSTALASVDRSARLLRYLRHGLLPLIWRKPTTAAHLLLLQGFARALREDAAAGGGGFKLAVRGVALQIEAFLREATKYAPYAGLRARVEKLGRSADGLLESTLTLRQHVEAHYLYLLQTVAAARRAAVADARPMAVADARREAPMAVAAAVAAAVEAAVEAGGWEAVEAEGWEALEARAMEAVEAECWEALEATMTAEEVAAVEAAGWEEVEAAMKAEAAKKKMAAVGALAPMILDGVQQGLKYAVDRAEHREPLRLVLARSVRVDEAGELAALLGLDIPGVGVVAVIGNDLALASVDRSARLLRFLKHGLIPQIQRNPATAAYLAVLQAVAGALREDGAKGGGRFKLEVRDVALQIEAFVGDHDPLAPYAVLRARVQELGRRADGLLKATVTLRQDGPVVEEAHRQAQAQEAAEAAAAEAEEAQAEV